MLRRLASGRRSWYWIIAPSGATVNTSTNALFNSTASAWFWVNSSQDITLAFDPDDEWEYATEGDLTITTNGSDADPWIAIFNNTNELIHDAGWTTAQGATGGDLDVSRNSSSFMEAGYYNVTAFLDIDGYEDAGDQIFYRETGTDYFRYWNSY